MDSVELDVKSNEPMNDLNLVVLNRHGIIYSHTYRDAREKREFNLVFPLIKEMDAGTSVIVFHIKNEKNYNSTLTLPLDLKLNNYVSIVC